MRLHGLKLNSFTFYVQMIFVPHRKHAYGLIQPVPGEILAFLYAGDLRTSPETYGLPWAVVRIALVYIFTILLQVS
jgi:hypothetical protein